MTLTATRTVPPPQPREDPAGLARSSRVSSSRPSGRPGWAWIGLGALLAGTALLYLWGLGRSGWANAYYSAAAQAAGRSWTAFLFGSLDPANGITVDKTPASLWLTGLSVRLFGLSSWSVLVPQALAGVAAVGVLHATVRRWYGDAAGLIAGAVMALTPVAVLMFRYNNPDALLTLLLVLAAYACVRAVETGATRWLVLAGALVGLGFLTKMLQALLVVPAIAVTYLMAGPVPLRRRLGQLTAGFLAMVVAAGWWVAAVDLVPASRRPFIGGSQHNSALELTVGYNGLGRLTGYEAGAIGNWWGYTGPDRLFRDEFAPGVSWLIPAALALLVAGLVVTAAAPWTDRGRAGFVLWGGWLLVTGLTFSYMAGIFHAYYNVALAPAIGALCGMGITLLWRRGTPRALLALAVVVAVTVGWSVVLHDRWRPFLPWLGVVAAVCGIGAGIALVVLALLRGPLQGPLRGRRRGRLRTRLAAAVLTVGLLAGFAAPVAWSIATAATPHEGAIPQVGPPPQDARPRVGNGGGLVDATRPNAEVVAALLADADRYTWVAATVGANNAAGYQLATGRPVLALGGFNGTDPFPTMAQFQELIAAGRIHYFLDSIRFRGLGGSDEAHEIAIWVHLHYPEIRIGGLAFHDLTRPPLPTTAA